MENSYFGNTDDDTCDCIKHVSWVLSFLFYVEIIILNYNITSVRIW